MKHSNKKYAFDGHARYMLSALIDLEKFHSFHAKNATKTLKKIDSLMNYLSEPSGKFDMHFWHSLFYTVTFGEKTKINDKLSSKSFKYFHESFCLPVGKDSKSDVLNLLSKFEITPSDLSSLVSSQESILEVEVKLMRLLYKESKNPLFLWRCIKICSDSRLPLPEWVQEYLYSSAYKLNVMAVKKDKIDLQKKILKIFKITSGRKTGRGNLVTKYQTKIEEAKTTLKVLDERLKEKPKSYSDIEQDLSLKGKLPISDSTIKKHRRNTLQIFKK